MLQSGGNGSRRRERQPAHSYVLVERIFEAGGSRCLVAAEVRQTPNSRGVGSASFELRYRGIGQPGDNDDSDGSIRP
jgi:hypothetical protein